MRNNKSLAGYVLLVLSVVIVCYYNFQKANVHMKSAWDFFPSMIVNVFSYGIAIIIAIAALLLIISAGDKKWKLLIVLSAIIVGFSFYYLYAKTKENNAAAYISAIGPHAFLKLRIDSTFRITNYGYHMAESWQEGHYTLAGNKIVLQCDGVPEAGLDKQLWIRRDTIYYGNAASDGDRLNQGLYLAILK
ncbi:MAG: hypothetical protein QM726_20945 [Chitinophagaceae bacterium]